ncbi:hypothetical protein Dimus_010717 [Dionaea muscipula]
MQLDDRVVDAVMNKLFKNYKTQLKRLSRTAILAATGAQLNENTESELLYSRDEILKRKNPKFYKQSLISV